MPLCLAWKEAGVDKIGVMGVSAHSVRLGVPCDRRQMGRDAPDDAPHVLSGYGGRARAGGQLGELRRAKRSELARRDLPPLAVPPQQWRGTAGREGGYCHDVNVVCACPRT